MGDPVGLLVTNTVGVHRVFRPGVQTYEFWLKIGIVALGSRFVLGDIVKLGGAEPGADPGGHGCGRRDHPRRGPIVRALRQAGLAARRSARRSAASRRSSRPRARSARNADVGYAIAAILALGAVALFTLPAAGHAIGLTDHEFGLWAGLAVDNTAETTATGYLYSEQAGKIAVLVKSARNALIGFVVLGFALYWASRGEADELAPGARRPRPPSSGRSFPKFVLGFLAVSAIATAGWLTKGQSTNLANVSRWAFLLTFAGVGLNTNFRELARTGWRPLVVAVIGLVVGGGGVARVGAADLTRIGVGSARELSYTVIDDSPSR